MKVSKLLASGALLLVGGAAAQAAIVDGVRQKPTPEKTDFVAGDTLLLCNKGTNLWWTGANDYQTRASVDSVGVKVCLTKHLKDGDTEWDGKSVIFNNYVNKFGDWRHVFLADDAGNMWVDNSNEADSIYMVHPLGNGLYRISIGADNPNRKWEAHPGTYLGIDLSLKEEDESQNTRVWAFLDPEGNVAVDWYFANAKAFDLAMEVYNTAEQLRGLFAKATEFGISTSEYEAVYANESATLEELEAAVAKISAAISKAEESNVSADNPVDKTADLIPNASYDNNKNDGWSGDTPAFQSYGNAEFYNKNFNYYQTKKNVANGVYAVKVNAFYRNGSSGGALECFNNGTKGLASLYAKSGADSLYTPLANIFAGASDTPLNVNGEISSGGKYIPNTMQSAATYFAQEGNPYENVRFFAVEDNEMTFGIAKTEKIDTDWTLFDDWKIIYYGNSAEAFKVWVKEAIANAIDVDALGEDVKVTVGMVDAYKAKMEEVLNASNKAEALAAEETIAAEAEILQANINAWQAYQDAFNKADETVNDEDIAEGELKEALGDLTWEAEDDFDALTLTTEEVLAKVETLLAAVDNCVKNSVKVGADVTNKFLVNARYEEGSTGWQGSPTVNGPKDNKCAEKYNCKFDVYQEVKDAPVGVYSITLQGFFRPGDNVVAWPIYSQNMKWEKETSIAVYANNNTSPLKCIYDEVVKKGELFQTESLVGPAPFEAEAENGDSIWFVNDMTNSGIAFSNDLYKSTAFGLVAKAGDVLRIGIKGELDNTNQWVCWDNFKMVYEGFKADIIAPQLTLALEHAAAYIQDGKPVQSMSKTAFDALKAAIDKGVEAQAGTDGKVMFDALSALFDAMEKATASVATFKTLVEAVEELQTLAMTSSASQETKNAALKLYTEIYEGVENFTIEDEQVEAYLAQISELRTKLMIPDEVASDDHAVDYTAVLVTPSFEDENGANSVDGWSFVDTKGSFGNDDSQKAALLYEFYEKEKVDMYQDIVGLPNGTYAITANAFCRMGSSDNDLASYVANPDTVSNAFIYGVSGEKMSGKGIMPISAGHGTEQVGSGAENTIQINGADAYIPNDMVSASAYFEIGRYLNTVIVNVTDGKLRVGVRKDEKVASDWLIIDNFKLYYYGDNSSKTPDADPTGINDLRLDQAARVEFFNVKGEKLNAAQKGINIMKMTQKDGTVVVKKVAID